MAHAHVVSRCNALWSYLASALPDRVGVERFRHCTNTGHRGKNSYCGNIIPRGTYTSSEKKKYTIT